MRIPRLASIAVALALVAGACTTGSESTPIVTGTSPDGEIVVGDTAPPNTPPPPPTCPQTTPVVEQPGEEPTTDFFDEEAGLASVHMSQALFECATHAVIVSDTDLDRVAVAAVLAASLDAPLLIATPNAAGLLAFETERLAPEQIIAVGDDVSLTAPEWTEIVRLSGDTATIAAQIDSLTGLVPSTTLPSERGIATVAATLDAITAGTTVTPSPSTTTTTTTTVAGDATTTTTIPAPVEREPFPSLSIGAGTTGVAILVDGNDPTATLAAFASAEAAGGVAALIDETDLRRVPGAGRALQSIPGGPGAISVFGQIPAESRWQLDVLRHADELPGGGYLVLPRVLVALYGNPLTTALGALGEQGPADAATRVEGMASQFAASDNPVDPAFEIITTVASGGPGGDGDYSTEMGNDVIQPWIDIGAEEGIYVILDLQPGRSDFLSQAKLYEQELLNPHVGLALDPEWRLAPDQVHLQQIGRVDAAEVNQVAEWLATLVREHDLPQKVFLLHQFREFMIQDRETLETPPELQMIIQMDGQGAVPDKYVTWEVLTRGWEDQPWRWGWKNFYDEDIPGGGISPLEFLQLEPEAVYVSYQ